MTKTTLNAAQAKMVLLAFRFESFLFAPLCGIMVYISTGDAVMAAIPACVLFIGGFIIHAIVQKHFVAQEILSPKSEQQSSTFHKH